MLLEAPDRFSDRLSSQVAVELLGNLSSLCKMESLKLPRRFCRGGQELTEASVPE